MSQSVVIVGCGGFGREVWSIIQALEDAGGSWTVEGFVDDSPTAHSEEQLAVLGSTVIGTVADLAGRRSPYSAVLAIGVPVARRRVHQMLVHSAVEYPPLVHPDTTLGMGINLAEGVVIASGARLSTNISVGAHAHIDQNVTVGHDTIIGEFARLNPQACVSGAVTIGAGALVGANATVLQGLTISAFSTVGAGACVVHNVVADTTVKGVPAR